MTVRLYRSTDGSAPTLSGTAGDLINLLDKCLVSGYGSSTAAGWTKPYTSTNAAAFRPGLGLQYYINIDDNGPGAGTGKEARAAGYEIMTAYATGSNLFPTATQSATGTFVRKSNTADATTRAWIVVADEMTFYLFILSGDVANAYTGFTFGEFYSYKSMDFGRYVIIGRVVENSATAGSEQMDLTQDADALASSVSSYIARDHQNNVGAVQIGKVGNQSFLSSPANGSALAGAIAYTNPANSKLFIAPVDITHTVGGNTKRGRMRGFWHVGHAISNFTNGDTFSGTGDLAGKTFLLIKQSMNAGIYCIETSTTWENN